MQSLWLVGTWLQMPPFYLKLEFLSQIAVRFDVGTIGKWIIGTISRWEKVLSLMLMLGEIPLMFILGVLNTSHVDLRGNTFHVHLGGVKYLSCWSYYWWGRVSNWLGLASKCITLIWSWSFVSQMSFKIIEKRSQKLRLMLILLAGTCLQLLMYSLRLVGMSLQIPHFDLEFYLPLNF